MSQLDHSNIVKLYEVYVNEEEVFIHSYTDNYKGMSTIWGVKPLNQEKNFFSMIFFSKCQEPPETKKIFTGSEPSTCEPSFFK